MRIIVETRPGKKLILNVGEDQFQTFHARIRPDEVAVRLDNLDDGNSIPECEQQASVHRSLTVPENATAATKTSILISNPVNKPAAKTPTKIFANASSQAPELITITDDIEEAMEDEDIVFLHSSPRVVEGTDKVTICVKVSQRRAVFVDICRNDIVRMLKAKLAFELNCEIEGMRIFLEDRELKDVEKLGDFDLSSSFKAEIAEDDYLNVKIFSISSMLMMLKMKSSDTVRELKSRIYTKLSYAPATQQLFWNGQQLKDRMPLSYYKLRSESKIELRVIDNSYLEYEEY